MEGFRERWVLVECLFGRFSEISPLKFLLFLGRFIVNYLIIRELWITVSCLRFLNLVWVIFTSHDVPDLEAMNFEKGWESVCWGGTIRFLGNLKDSKNWSSKNTKIPRPSKNIQKISKYFQKYIDLIRYTYVFGLRVHNYSRFTEIPPSYFPIFI